MSSLVSITCQSIIARTSAPASKRLAYDVVAAATLTDEDWGAVCQGLQADIGGGLNTEVTSLQTSETVNSVLAFPVSADVSTTSGAAC